MEQEKIKLRISNAVNLDLIDLSPSILMELRDHFSFFAPGYKFHKLYKQKRWDGKIHLVNVNKPRLYIGLFPDLVEFCNERKYRIEFIENKFVSFDDVFGDSSLDEDDARILDSIPKKYEPRDYQQDAIVSSIEKRRQIVLSSVGSGKSLIIYLLSFWFLRKHEKKVLIVVPTTSLVSQMKSDFIEYSMNEKVFSPLIHEIYSGKEKHNISAPIIISTFQSIAGKMNPEWFHDFGMVIVDECHRASAKSFIDILEKCGNSFYRIGTTGTIPKQKDQKIAEMTMKGLIGPVKRFTTTKELQEKKQLAELEIDCVVLKHDPKNPISAIAKNSGIDPSERYQKEIEYLCTNENRNRFIIECAMSNRVNTLVLFNLVEKHGKVLHEMARSLHPERDVFFISGETDTDERETIRKYVEKKQNGCVIFASSSVFSTGINIKNLSCIIFAQSFKSQIRVIQSIGRGLRISDDGSKTLLIDIIDDLHPRRKSKKNYTYNHGIERLQYYTDEKWTFKIREMELADLMNNDIIIGSSSRG